MFCNRFLSSGYGLGGGMFLMMISGFLIFLVLIFLVFKTMKSNSTSPFVSENSAINILNERYAKGEIDDEEYTNKKIILSKKN